MKTCFSCRHLYECRMDYDRRYPCRDYESKTYTKKPARGSGTDEGKKDNTAGGQEENGITYVDGGHEERA